MPLTAGSRLGPYEVLSPFGAEPNVFGPVLWSPDGREVYYGRRREGLQGIFARPPAGGTERVVFENEVMFKSQTALSPDGRHLLYRQLDPVTSWDLWSLPIAGGPPTRVTTGAGEESNGRFSPDGRWILYDGFESGRAELYVCAFPSGEGRIQITSGGGANARWVPDTWEIIFADPAGRIMRMPVTPGSPPQFGTPSELTGFRDAPGRYFRGSVTRDGQRFLTSWGDGDGQDPTLTVLVNWWGMVGE